MSSNTKIDLTCYTSQSDSLALVPQKTISYIKHSSYLLQENYQPHTNFACTWLSGSLKLESWNHKPARCIWQQIWIESESQPWGTPELSSHTWARPDLTWWKAIGNKQLVWHSGSRSFQVPFHWGNDQPRQSGNKEWLIFPRWLLASPQLYLIPEESE